MKTYKDGHESVYVSLQSSLHLDIHPRDRFSDRTIVFPVVSVIQVLPRNPGEQRPKGRFVRQNMQGQEALSLDENSL